MFLFNWSPRHIKHYCIFFSASHFSFHFYFFFGFLTVPSFSLLFWPSGCVSVTLSIKARRLGIAYFLRFLKKVRASSPVYVLFPSYQTQLLWLYSAHPQVIFSTPFTPRITLLLPIVIYFIVSQPNAGLGPKVARLNVPFQLHFRHQTTSFYLNRRLSWSSSPLYPFSWDFSFSLFLHTLWRYHLKPSSRTLETLCHLALKGIEGFDPWAPDICMSRLPSLLLGYSC